MDDCIFCKIARGEIPCYKIYENDKVIAFLDTSPFAKGHTLVVPKNHSQDIHDIPEEDLKEVILAVKIVAKILKEKLGCAGMHLWLRNGKAAGQEVMHLHFHLVPRFEGDGIDAEAKSSYAEKDLESVHKMF